MYEHHRQLAEGIARTESKLALLPCYVDKSITLGRFLKVESGENLGHLLPGNREIGCYLP